MAFVKVATLSNLKPGWSTEVQLDGHPYAICNLDGEIHAMDGSCCCTGGPLGHGAIRDGLLICPWHGWRFDIRTGICAYDEDICQTKFPVKIEGDDILIDVSSVEQHAG